MNRVMGSCLICFLVFMVSSCRPETTPPPEIFAGVPEAVAEKLADPQLCPRGSQEEVQEWLNHPGADGWARLPAGCYRIETSLVIPTGARVAGAGMTETILFRDPEQFTGREDPLMVSFSQREGPVITGLALVGVQNSADTGEDEGIRLASGSDFRIDHCYFAGFGAAGVRVDGATSGVIDHSLFVDNFKTGIDNLGYGVVVYGDDRWVAEMAPGSATAVFVEDNLFVGNRHAIASNGGAAYVFRHNLVQGNVVAHAIDAHGPGYGWTHGTRLVEVYDNVLEAPVYREAGITIRGGAGVIFGNTIRGYRKPIQLVVEWGTPEALKASYPAKEQIHDLWIWDNEAGEVVIDATAEGFVEIGRDVFLEPKPGYVPYPYPHPLTTVDLSNLLFANFLVR